MLFSTCAVTYQGAYVVASFSEPFGQAASDLSGRSGDENFHVQNVATGGRCDLEESDMRGRLLA